MRCCRAEGIDFKLRHAAGREFCEKFIENERDDDAALAVANENDLLHCGINKDGFDVGISYADVLGFVGKGALD